MYIAVAYLQVRDMCGGVAMYKVVMKTMLFRYGGCSVTRGWTLYILFLTA
jgi:hypothetical protein